MAGRWILNMWVHSTGNAIIESKEWDRGVTSSDEGEKPLGEEKLMHCRVVPIGDVSDKEWGVCRYGKEFGLKLPKCPCKKILEEADDLSSADLSQRAS